MPEDWTLEEINSAIPEPYVSYLLHHCPSIDKVEMPDMTQAKMSLYE